MNLFVIHNSSYLNIVGHKRIFLSTSAILVLASLVAIVFWGLKLGIDFTGGSLLEVEFAGTRPEVSAIKNILVKTSMENATIQPAGDKSLILRFGDIGQEEHIRLLDLLRSLSGGEVVEKRFDSIGPTIGAELKKGAITSLALAIIGIVLYIAWTFRGVSEPVASWKYGVVAVAALVHDITIPTGIFAILGKFGGIEIDTLFITALLTILGFSVHDTIVVFDRIRENLRKQKNGQFEEVVNHSMNETMARSVNTSLTVLLVVLAIFFFGASTTKWFSLALGLGVIFGTYSSIFVASPLLVLWHGISKRKQNG